MQIELLDLGFPNFLGIPPNHPSHWTFSQWEFQDPKMKVLYHIRPYFLGIFPYIGLI